MLKDKQDFWHFLFVWNGDERNVAGQAVLIGLFTGTTRQHYQFLRCASVQDHGLFPAQDPVHTLLTGARFHVSDRVATLAIPASRVRALLEASP